jgi:hypothetical protein
MAHSTRNAVVSKTIPKAIHPLPDGPWIFNASQASAEPELRAPRKIPLAKSLRIDSAIAGANGWMERGSHGVEGLFDVETRLEAISAKGDPLETIKCAPTQ